MAHPPIHAWMPNHPHATSARRIAGTFAPSMPNAGRQYTGKGMPYFVPACALSTMGTSTIVLPRKMVTTACHQLIPSAMSDDASMYVGTHADIEIHNAAMSFVAHL